MNSGRILNSAFTVLAFWGFVLSVYFSDGSFDYTLGRSEFFAAVAGITLAVVLSNNYRETIFVRLTDHEYNGMVCGLGPVPLHGEQPCIDKRLNLKRYRSSLPLELAGFSPYQEYVGVYAKQPPFCNLFDAILRLLLSSRNYSAPATYSTDATGERDPAWVNPNAHGGRTLAAHSLLVSGLMIKNAEDFFKSYRPHQPSKAQDPNYVPNHIDPLIGLLGIAHDIGKLKTIRFERDAKGRIAGVRIAKNHDVAGVRILAAIPEYWVPEISSEDRAILQNILAVYHHPHSLPIEPDEADPENKYRYRSDRERALLALLIHCDTAASKIENGKMMDLVSVDNSKVVKTEESDEPITDFKSSFFQFMVANGLSNRNGKSLGFKTTDADGRVLIAIDQNVFLESFADHLNKPYIKEKRPGNQVNPVTGTVLQMLDELGVVYRALQDDSRSAETCVYQTEIYDKKGEKFLTMNYAFILDISHSPEFAFFKGVPDSASRFEFVKSKFGAQGNGAKVRMSTDFGIVQEDLTGKSTEHEMLSIETLVLSAANKRTKKKPSRQAVLCALPLKIPKSIKQGDLQVFKEYVEDGRVHQVFVGQDAWFAANGVLLGKLDQNERIALNFVQVNPSKTVPGEHVVVYRPA